MIVTHLLSLERIRRQCQSEYALISATVHAADTCTTRYSSMHPSLYPQNPTSLHAHADPEIDPYFQRYGVLEMPRCVPKVSMEPSIVDTLSAAPEPT